MVPARPLILSAGDVFVKVNEKSGFLQMCLEFAQVALKFPQDLCVPCAIVPGDGSWPQNANNVDVLPGQGEKPDGTSDRGSSKGSSKATGAAVEPCINSQLVEKMTRQVAQLRQRRERLEEEQAGALEALVGGVVGGVGTVRTQESARHDRGCRRKQEMIAKLEGIYGNLGVINDWFRTAEGRSLATGG